MKELWELFITFCRIGAFMFGGGYSMIPLLNKELVDKKGWTTEEQLLDYFAISQCTPGIIAVNTATFIGHERKGVAGSAAATFGVVFVPTLIILAIAAVLQNFWSSPIVQHIFGGIRVAVAALILSAVVRLVRSSVKDWFGIVLCLLGFVAIAFFSLSPVIVVVAAAIAGLVMGRIKKA